MSEPETTPPAPAREGRGFPWGLVAVVALLVWGPAWLYDLRPKSDGELWDFFQDWASARFYLDGRGIYTDQIEAIRAYQGAEVRLDHPRAPFNKVNAHPPAAVLFYLPLARLDYPTAQMAWSLFWLTTVPLSAWLVFRQAGVSVPGRALLAAVPLLLWCMPLRADVFQGQVNRFLLLLVVAAWALDRNGRPWLAGACLGVAASVKAFPALLFGYFLLRRRWAALGGGALAGLALNGVALALFGPEAFVEFLTRVVPATAERYRDDPFNVSLAGFWSRLFDPPTGAAVPALASRPLYLAASLGSRAAVVGAAAWLAWRARSPAARDHAFGAAILATLLVSPITWAPYLLLLLVPAGLLWRDLPRGPARWAFLACLLYLWFADLVVLFSLGREFWLRDAAPWESLTYLACSTYALVGLLLLSIAAARRADLPPRDIL